jgi:hypothetical protein
LIVQTAPRDRPHFVIEQLEHTALAGRFAAAWGNDGFAPLAPHALMLWVVAHHDEGWDLVDAEIGRDADSGLPWNLVRTPIPAILRAGARSPELAERSHPFSGLLVSMHVYGLYCGRYGLSDKVFVDTVPAEHKPAVEELLTRELARQDRLRQRLADDPELAQYVFEEALFHNYKLLQFFDTLALYFNCTHDAARDRVRFTNVPRRRGDEVTITIERIDEKLYRLAPYPFARPRLTFGCAGRFVAPQPARTDVVRLLGTLPVEHETFTLVAP